MPRPASRSTASAPSPAARSAGRSPAPAPDFFQALRLVDAAFPGPPRPGQAQRAVDEPVRLGQEPSLAFAPSTLSRCTPNGDGHARLMVNFLGLLGPNGPLPLHITE